MSQVIYNLQCMHVIQCKVDKKNCIHVHVYVRTRDSLNAFLKCILMHIYEHIYTYMYMCACNPRSTDKIMLNFIILKN